VAPKLLAHLERWHQTEWPNLKVYMASVTDQYATAAIAGGLAWHMLHPPPHGKTSSLFASGGALTSRSEEQSGNPGEDPK